MNLNNMYDKAIVQTWFKSEMLTKVNYLRKELGLKTRHKALPEKTYDKQLVDEVGKVDFSSLDGNIVSQTLGWSNSNFHF